MYMKFVRIRIMSFTFSCDRLYLKGLNMNFRPEKRHCEIAAKLIGIDILEQLLLITSNDSQSITDS
jgi:hypothetical protein